MEAFVNTAYRYLKGESELPSLLPSKESADMAKEKSRKVRLFCKGLECFCEILYRETVAEEQHVDPKVAHNDAVMVADEELIEAPMGQDQTMMTAEENCSKSTVQQNAATPSVIDTDTENSVTNKLAASADRERDQEHPGAEITVLDTKADQKPRKYVLESGENLFQSLYATDKTPPTSPGGASSSSTLVDPSSRKVSPSESTMDPKSSPTAAKDFAYSSLDAKHVRDPLSIAEEQSKLELVRQLKKKTAGEARAARKAEEQKAKNLALSAELEAARRELRSKEVEADVTRVHANAVIVSNFFLRNAMRDRMGALRDGRLGVEVETTKAAGETVGNQDGEGGPLDKFRSAGTLVASAYSDEEIFSESPDEFGEESAHADATVSIQLEQTPPMGENVEIECFGSSAVEHVDRHASEKPGRGSIGSRVSASDSASQLECNAEGFLGRSKGKVNDLSKEIDSDELALSGTMTSVESTGSKAFNEVKMQGKDDSTDDIRLASNREDQESSSSINRSSWTEVETEISDSSNTQVEDFTHRHNQKDEEQVCVGQSIAQVSSDLQTSIHSTSSLLSTTKMPDKSDDKPHKPADFESQEVEEVEEEPTAGVDEEDPADESSDDESSDEGVEDETNDLEGTCVGREGGSHDPFEFSEPAGPSTLWGILQSSRVQDEAVSDVNDLEEAASVRDAAGPATLWGILHSNQSEHQAKDTTVADDDTAGGDEGATLAPTNSPVSDDSPAAGPGRSGGWVPAPAPPQLNFYEQVQEWARQEREFNEELAFRRALREDAERYAVPSMRDDSSEADSESEPRTPSPRRQASLVASEGVPGEVGAKSNDSDLGSLAPPWETEIPVPRKCPRKWEGETLEAPHALHMQGTKQDDLAGKDDQTTCDGNSGTIAAEDGEVASGGEDTQSCPILFEPETSSVSLGGSVPQKQAQAPELSKTQKRKLERKRAAAKKAEEAKRLRAIKEEEAA